MTNEELIAYLTGKFPEAEIKSGAQYPEMTVKAKDLHESAAQLKEIPELSFDYVFCLTGVDYAENMGIIYHLESVQHRHILVLKVRTADRVNPAIDTVSDVSFSSCAAVLRRRVHRAQSGHFLIIIILTSKL